MSTPVITRPSLKLLDEISLSITALRVSHLVYLVLRHLQLIRIPVSPIKTHYGAIPFYALSATKFFHDNMELHLSE